MRIPFRVSALGLAFLLLAGGCTGGGKPGPSVGASASPLRRGGTLRVGIYGWDPTGPIDPTTLFGEPGGGWQCCLQRMLYSYSGRPVAEGGSVLRSDLATGPPEVSSDGMTWTFHMKAGLH